MRLHCKTALTYMFEPPVFKRSLFWGGLLLLLFPPLGWPVALGYRSMTLRRLLDAGEVAEIKLPQELGRCFASGVGAVAVIFLYFVPFMVLYWALAASPSEVLAHPLEVTLFFALVLFLVPGFLPTLPLGYALKFSWIAITPGEIAALVAVFLATTFLMPAVFMQVSLAGSHWGAARCVRAVRAIFRSPRVYLEAWVLSLLLIGASLLFFPFFGWITFWAYLAIGALFNEVLTFDEDREVRERMRFFAQRFRGRTAE